MYATLSISELKVKSYDRLKSATTCPRATFINKCTIRKVLLRRFYKYSHFLSLPLTSRVMPFLVVTFRLNFHPLLLPGFKLAIEYHLY